MLLFYTSPITIKSKSIWDGKPAKIKRKTLIGEKNGGLKMCDFSVVEKALKIAWINRVQNSLLAEALFLLFADGRKETSAMGRKGL